MLQYALALETFLIVDLHLRVTLKHIFLWFNAIEFSVNLSESCDFILINLF